MDSTYEVKLTENEVNTVLASLAKMPYEAVFSLIAKVQQQCNDQINQRADSAKVVSE